MEKIDFFISHASEDKDSFVRSLADTLILSGASVFYDEYTIKLGDSLTESINYGISKSKNGIIVFSEYFLQKGWTNAELQALFNKSIRERFKLILVFHGISHDSIAAKYPLLSDIRGISSSVGLYKVVNEIHASTGFQSNMTFAYTQLSLNQEQLQDGISITIRIGFPLLGDLRNDKVFFEIGQKENFNTRLRLYLYRNQRIYFEFVDCNYNKFAISADVSEWLFREPHTIVANFDVPNRSLSLFIDSNKVVELSLANINFDNETLNNFIVIAGSNLELDYPSPFIISYLSLGKALTNDEAVSMSNIVETFNNMVNR